MSVKISEVDVFDSTYRDKIRNAVWLAIIEAARDSETGVVPLRNYEIYDALLQLQAMILASSKQSKSQREIRQISNAFVKRLRHHVAQFKKMYDHEGLPFEIIHTDEMQ